MGFRSVFITEDVPVKVPDWFIKKYPKVVCQKNERDGGNYLPLALAQEQKFYLKFNETSRHFSYADIFIDIQKLIKEQYGGEYENVSVILILLHECGGITRVKITKDSITGREPTGWKEVDMVEHNYCYGCSDKYK